MNKFEQLIEFVINDETDKARELFHNIVVEKSRNIYEDIMAAEDDGFGGSEVEDLVDDIESEEEGTARTFEDEEEMEMDPEGEVEFEIDGEEDFGDEGEGEELEDRVVDLEDKLDELMAEFEELMGADSGDDMDMEPEMDDMGDEEFGDEEEQFESEEADEEALEENVSLTPVKAKMGDNGAYTKSPVAANSGAKGMASKPVKTATGDEKGRTAPKAKDMGSTTKGDLKPAPKASNNDGADNKKSPL